MTLQLGMVVLNVRDVDRSIAIYRLLGLDVRDRHPDRPVTVYRMDSGVSMVLIEDFAVSMPPVGLEPTTRGSKVGDLQHNRHRRRRQFQ